MAMASSSFDTLNVIYRLYTLILLVCLPQIYVHSSPYTSLIIRNALKYNNDSNFSRNHQPRRPRLPPFFMLIPHRFVRRNFIGHHGWNGRESTNQSRSFCRHVYLRMTSCLSVLMQIWPPMRLCAIYWLIVLCSWPKMGAQRKPTIWNNCSTSYIYFYCNTCSVMFYKCSIHAIWKWRLQYWQNTQFKAYKRWTQTLTLKMLLVCVAK